MMIKDPYGFIYITTNMVNGKRYIGQRKFSRKWQSYLGSGAVLREAFKKYGKENFIRDIVDIGYSAEELNDLEIEWIKNYNAYNNRNFYNIADGGKSGNAFAGKTEDEMLVIKNKISLANRGKELSYETRLKISKTLKGKYIGTLNWNYGKKLSENVKLKISKAVTGENNGFYGRSHSMETRLKIAKSQSIKVICLTTNKIFNSAEEASQYYKCDRADITKCCKKRKKYCGKLDSMRLVWMYYEEYLLLSTDKINSIIKNAYINDNYKLIKCITTGEIFNNMTIACRKYNLDPSSLTKCCKGKIKSTGKHPITGEKLIWKYLEDSE